MGSGMLSVLVSNHFGVFDEGYEPVCPKRIQH